MNGFEQLLERARTLVAERERRAAAVSTPGEFRRRQADLRERFREMLGVRHMPRDRMRASLTGTVAANDIVIEKWLLEPFDGYAIPLLLYKPAQAGDATLGEPAGAGSVLRQRDEAGGEHRQPPPQPPQSPPWRALPCVLAPVGHYNEGKAAESYQLLCSQLASMGYTVACFDPIGQGERSFERPDPDRPDYEAIVNCVNQHSRLGALGYLVGANIAMLFVYDAMCVMDFVARQTGDDRFICTGHSGGGTLTAYLMAIDERIVQAIPTHYVTTFLQLLEHNRAAPGDHEQSLFGFLAEGFDMADYLWMAAPKPVLLNAAEYDFFPIAGTKETFAEAKRIYALLGAEDNVQLSVAPVEHSLTRDVRERIYSFLAGGTVSESDWPVRRAEALYCTVTGDAWAGRNRALELLRGMIGRKAAAVDETGRNGAADGETALNRDSAATGITAIRDWLASAMRIHDADAFAAPEGATAFIRKAGNERLLVLCDLDGTTDGWDLNAVCESGCNVLKVDVWERELTRLAGQEPPPIAYNEDMRLTLYAAVCGEQVAAIRLRQLLTAIDRTVRASEPKPQQIVLFGSGAGGILVNIAALFVPDVAKVINVGTWRSFRQLFSGLDYHFAPSSTIYGMLRRFDLDDIVAALAATPVTIVNPIGPSRCEGNGGGRDGNRLGRDYDGDVGTDSSANSIEGNQLGRVDICGAEPDNEAENDASNGQLAGRFVPETLVRSTDFILCEISEVANV